MFPRLFRLIATNLRPSIELTVVTHFFKPQISYSTTHALHNVSPTMSLRSFMSLLQTYFMCEIDKAKGLLNRLPSPLPSRVRRPPLMTCNRLRRRVTDNSLPLARFKPLYPSRTVKSERVPVLPIEVVRPFATLDQAWVSTVQSLQLLLLNKL